MARWHRKKTPPRQWHCALCGSGWKWPLCASHRRRLPAPVRLIKVLIAEDRRRIEVEHRLSRTKRGNTRGKPWLKGWQEHRNDLRWYAIYYFNVSVQRGWDNNASAIMLRDRIARLLHEGHRLTRSQRQLVAYADGLWLRRPWDLLELVASCREFPTAYWSHEQAARLLAEGWRVTADGVRAPEHYYDEGDDEP